MDKQLFIFSRTQKVDYGVMVSPTSEFCPKEVKMFFREQVRGLLNADQYTPDFTTPRWLLSRVGDLTLWGVGCWNETHSDQFTTDEAGRSHLRNFVGIVYQGNVQELPYDIDYFSAEFNKHIGKLWTMSRMDIQIATGVTPEDYAGSKTIKGGVAPGLNKMPNRSLTIDPSKAEGLIGAALVTGGDVSIATNLLDVKLACDERYQFMNASVLNHPGGQVHSFTVPSKIPVVVVTPKPGPVPPTPEPPTPEPPKPEPPKPGPVPPKPLSPVGEKKSSNPFKIIAFIELLIIICLVIAYCAKGGCKETEKNDDKQEPSDKKEQIDKKTDKEGKPEKNVKPIKVDGFVGEADDEAEPEKTIEEKEHD